MESTIVVTVLNEENSIGSLIESILKQTIMPTEVILVDGGSKDRTVDICYSYMNEFDFIKVFILPKANISLGRNFGIANAKNEIIAITDAGCTLDPNWLKCIISPLINEVNIDVVGGWYAPEVHSIFQEAASVILFQRAEDIKSQKFLPSARSISFRKNVWRDIGGYPEWLKIGEDTYFDVMAKQKGYRFYFEEKAIVYFQPRKNLKEIWRQYYFYSKGDGLSGILLNYYLVKYYLPYLTVLFFIFLGFQYSFIFLYAAIILFLLYLSYWFIKARFWITNNAAYLLVPIIIVTTEITRILGYSWGVLNRILNTRKK